MNNFDLMESNESSKASNGGTELTMRNLYDGSIPRELLENFQIIPSRPRELIPGKIRILAAHDLPEDAESNKFKDQQFIRSLHKIVYTSEWQYSRYQLLHGLPYDDRAAVIASSIDPSPAREFAPVPEDETVHIAYTSTPQRGLEILIPVFEMLCERHKNIHLHVFSSFKIYGWENADEPFEGLYDRCREHPQITYHGYTPHDELMRLLPQYHVFAYPCIWLETFCRAMAEAMSAGLICVHPNYGALAETSGGLNLMYQGHQDLNTHANAFAPYLSAAITMARQGVNHDTLRFNKHYVDMRYNKGRIQLVWTNMLQQLLAKYPTAESREVPKEMFTYRT